MKMLNLGNNSTQHDSSEKEEQIASPRVCSPPVKRDSKSRGHRADASRDPKGLSAPEN
jgi:hypothetical protein